MDKFEAHIAIPKIPKKRAEEVLRELRAIGMQYHDYFLRLQNYAGANQPLRFDPSAHDIAQPYLVTTANFECAEKAIETIKAGMAALVKHGVYGANFELEADLDVDNPPTIADFPDFQQHPDAPAFEVHILWEGPRSVLPKDRDIITYHQQAFGYSPHQIADFGLKSRPERGENIWRVSTVCFPAKEQASQFHSKVLIPGTWWVPDGSHFPGARKVIAERLCVVTQPMKNYGI